MRRPTLSVLDPYPARLVSEGVGGLFPSRVWVSHVRTVTMGAGDENLAIVADPDRELAYERAQRACWALIHGPSMERVEESPDLLVRLGESSVQGQFAAPFQRGDLRLAPLFHGAVANSVWSLDAVENDRGETSLGLLFADPGRSHIILAWARRAPLDWRHQSQFLITRRAPLEKQLLRELVDEVVA
jgi:hypothetical protein